MQEHSLKKRYAIKLLASVINGIIGAVLIAIVPKALGPIMYGQFVYLQQFFMKIIGFLDAGSSIAFFTKLSARPERKELITFYSLYSLTILIIMMLFFYFVDALDYTTFFLPNIDTKYLYLAIGFTFLTWSMQIFIKISDAYALTVSVESIKIIHKITTLFLLLYFINFLNFDLTKYFYFHYISLVSFILIVSYLFYKKDIFSAKLLTLKINIKKLVYEFVSYCSPLLVYSIVGLAAGLFDIWLLQKISGSTQTGYYGLAYSIAAICFIFAGAMTPIITREFSRSYEKKDLENMQTLFKKYIPMLYSVAAYFSVFISIQSENVLAIFTDEEFAGAYLVLVVMALYPIHQTYGQLSGSIFYATGQTKLYRNIGVISMGIGFLITLFLIYILELGALGLALKMLIVQFVVVNIQLYFNAKFLNLKIQEFIWHQLYPVLFFAFAASLSTYMIDVTSPVMSFLISGMLYTAISLLFIAMFPAIIGISKQDVKYALNKIRR